MTPLARQFASTARLFSGDHYAKLRQAHVGVVGVGGVGSWAAEALARSGVGRLTLVDMDHVAESNLNRQVQALHSTLGAAKVEVLKARIADIAPDCDVRLVDDFLSPENAAEILGRPGTIWIDATDDLKAKIAMVLVMRDKRRLKDLMVSGGAGGKTDPTRIEAADLSETTQDALLSSLRYDLRRHHGFSRAGKMKIQAVYCRQQAVQSDDCDASAKLACAGYGSLVTVTASMGMTAASLAMQRAVSKES
jgi:tRNA A37 threonylcarbamoyladenosine dehydratase